jgi:hypothetical protein
VFGRAANLPARPLLRHFLMHAKKKSNHDCFSFVQRKMEIPTSTNTANRGLYAFRPGLDVF